MDEPNAIFSVKTTKASLPNVLGTTTPLEDGMDVHAVNAWPSAERDIKGGLDLFHRWLGAGFYYKTFIWPDWHLFEPMIRKMAGLGHVDPALIEGYVSNQTHDHCDLLVIGGGAAGLIAAQTAAEAGQSVWLVDDHPELGGGLYRRGQMVEGLQPSVWVAERIKAILRAGGRILTRTTVFGAFDHGAYGLIEEHGFGKAPTLHRLRAARTILATGAIDRPVTFANNDLPGIHSLEAGLDYLGRYGVLVGSRVAIAANHTLSREAADRLASAGADIVVLIPPGSVVAEGKKSVLALSQDVRRAPSIRCLPLPAGRPCCICGNMRAASSTGTNSLAPSCPERHPRPWQPSERPTARSISTQPWTRPARWRSEALSSRGRGRSR